MLNKLHPSGSKNWVNQNNGDGNEGRKHQQIRKHFIPHSIRLIGSFTFAQLNAPQILLSARACGARAEYDHVGGVRCIPVVPVRLRQVRLCRQLINLGLDLRDGLFYVRIVVQNLLATVQYNLANLGADPPAKLAVRKWSPHQRRPRILGTKYFSSNHSWLMALAIPGVQLV